ncbi:hypothetical protein N431DRAFT_439926 [Stipitochalara longipes BDJ]|nr:hypothetical protein N431DRAFT_439926 [Stipitochalara longipes BDJ]
MSVSLKTISIASPEWTSDPTHFVHVLSNLLSKSECEGIIKAHTNLVPSAVTIGTIRTREQFDDSALCEKIWSRIAQFYKDKRIKDEDGYWWKCKGLNVHMRLSKYNTGGIFTPHFDYRRMANLNLQSFCSVNIYLNDVPEDHGGATRILQHDIDYMPGSNMALNVLGKIQPVQGTASIFRETVWHDGELLSAGVKYLLRTDLMFEREGEFDFVKSCEGLSGTAKANKALDIFYSLQEGGNSSEADEWRARAFELSFFQ